VNIIYEYLPASTNTSKLDWMAAGNLERQYHRVGCTYATHLPRDIQTNYLWNTPAASLADFISAYDVMFGGNSAARCGIPVALVVTGSRNSDCNEL